MTSGVQKLAVAWFVNILKFTVSKEDQLLQAQLHDWVVYPVCAGFNLLVKYII